MKVYIVKCEIPFGYDDTYCAEWDGVKYRDRKKAEIELKKANADAGIISAYIEECEI